MLVLTAVTAVQRFVTVWRQASAPRPAPVPQRCGGRRAGRARTTERVKVRRERWASRTRPLAGGPPVAVPSRPARVPARLRRSPGRCRGPVADVLAARGGRRRRRRSAASGAAQVERNLRRVHGPSSVADRRCAAACADTFASYARYWVESFRLPGTAARGARRRHHASRAGSTSRPARDGGQGRDPRPAPPRRLGVGRVLGGRGASRCPSPSWSRRSSRPTSTSGSSGCGESFGMHVVPLGPDGSRPRCSARSATTTSCACSATATSAAAASRSSSSASAPRCPAVRPPSPCAPGAPLLPGGRLLRGHAAHRGIVRPALDTARTGQACATTCSASPRTLADELEALIRRAPEQWHLLQPNWPVGLGSSTDGVMRVGMVCPYSLTVPGGVQMQVLGPGPLAARRSATTSRVLAPVRRPAARRRRHRRSAPACPPPPTARWRRIAPDPAAQLRTIAGAPRRGASTSLHLHEPLVPRAHARPRCSCGRAPWSARSTPPATAPPTATCGPLVRWLANRLDHRCAVSDDAAALAGRYLGGKYTPVFNGIEVEPLRQRPSRGPPRARRSSSSAATSPARASTSCSTPWPSLPADVRLWVGGDGPDTEELQARHADDHRIEWLGRISDDGEVPPHPGRPRPLRAGAAGRVLRHRAPRGDGGAARRWSRATSTATATSPRDGRDALLVPPGDADALAKALSPTSSTAVLPSTGRSKRAADGPMLSRCTASPRSTSRSTAAWYSLRAATGRWRSAAECRAARRSSPPSRRRRGSGDPGWPPGRRRPDGPHRRRPLAWWCPDRRARCEAAGGHPGSAPGPVGPTPAAPARSARSTRRRRRPR